MVPGGVAEICSLSSVSAETGMPLTGKMSICNCMNEEVANYEHFLAT